jgi:4-amino-4-deoxy-L-arabinose transferase-like glycosyltransferase
MNTTNLRRIFPPVALFLMTLLLHCAGTWILPLVDRDEPWYAEVSREMNERGDYVVPYFNNQFWLEKTPLLFWSQALSYRLFGENEFAARLPSAVATALTALVILGFCTSLYDRRTAWRAAIAFVLCLQMLIFGKAGVTDMPMVLFTTLAAWAGWELCRDGARKHWWWIFYLSVAGAALAKGPLAVIPPASVAVFWIWTRKPGLLRTMKFGRGLTLALLVSALWFVPVLILTRGEFYKVFIGRQVIERSLSPMDGHGASNALAYIATLPFYFLAVFVTFLPWSFYLPAAWSRIKAHRSAADIYLASGILLTFCLFSLARTKLPHYTLPAFPLIACAVAPCLPQKRFIRLAAGMAALNFAIAFLLFPLAARYAVAPHLAASPLLRDGMEIAVVNYHEPGLVWYLRGRVKSWPAEIQAGEVEAFMKKNGARACILPSKTAAQIPVDPAWSVTSAKGFNISNGKPVELLMLVKM